MATTASFVPDDNEDDETIILDVDDDVKQEDSGVDKTKSDRKSSDLSSKDLLVDGDDTEISSNDDDGTAKRRLSQQQQQSEPRKLLKVDDPPRPSVNPPVNRQPASSTTSNNTDLTYLLFVCEDCGSGFYRQALLADHVSVAHNKEISPLSDTQCIPLQLDLLCPNGAVCTIPRAIQVPIRLNGGAELRLNLPFPQEAITSRCKVVGNVARPPARPPQPRISTDQPPNKLFIPPANLCEMDANQILISSMIKKRYSSPGPQLCGTRRAGDKEEDPAPRSINTTTSAYSITQVSAGGTAASNQAQSGTNRLVLASSSTSHSPGSSSPASGTTKPRVFMPYWVAPEPTKFRPQVVKNVLIPIASSPIAPTKPLPDHFRRVGRFPCSVPDCTTSHLNIERLLYHLHLKHRLANPVASLPVPCKCGKLFPSSGVLLKHFAEAHRRDRSIHCRVCGQLFTTPSCDELHRAASGGGGGGGGVAAEVCGCGLPQAHLACDYVCSKRKWELPISKKWND